jgi:serine phosphatase RsbU (regulator of sigma subunit)/FixJ family two-component response regulator
MTVVGAQMAANRSILLYGLPEAAERFALEHFTQAGHGVATTKHGQDSNVTIQDPQLDVIYLQSAVHRDVLDDLKQIQQLQPGLPVVLVGSQPSAPLTLEAWHAGAADVLFPPFTAESLNASLDRAVRLRASRETQAPELQARFRFLDDAGKERWAAVVHPRFTIGRSSSNDLVFSQMSISRSQAEVQVQNGEYILRDLGSKHGTYLNGTRIEQARLSDGDRIQLGGLQGQTLTFHVGDLLQSLLGFSDSRPETGISVRGFREIGMLLATLRALSSIPLLDDLLALVVDTAIEVTGAERGFIMLKDETEQLSFRCARNSYKRPLDGSSFQTSRRVPHEVFKTGKRVVINDLDLGDTSDDHSSTRRLGLRSIFCVPLRYLTFHESGNLSGIGRMETLGVLYVDSQTIGTGLSNTQIEALETLASEAAMAIYNARLYRDSQEKRKMDEELAIAREIQQALLPNPDKTLPFVTACSRNLPCREVGGDYFDYFDMEGGRLGFALGDVAGKGMPAALLTSMIQGIFSAQTLLDLTPPSIISNVNRNLVRRGTGNRFVTFFFGILDPDGNCTYTNAGHNPPFVLRRDGSLCELTEGGIVLGLFADAQYESRTIKLDPGDHVVLYTDGVLEALNTAGEEFGERRLQELLQESRLCTTAEILSRLQEAVTAFSANTPQHDDITMMVLGYQVSDAGVESPAQARSSLGFIS